MMLTRNLILISFSSNYTIKVAGAAATLELNSFGKNLEVPEPVQVKLTNIAMNLSQLLWLRIRFSVALW